MRPRITDGFNLPNDSDWTRIESKISGQLSQEFFAFTSAQNGGRLRPPGQFYASNDMYDVFELLGLRQDTEELCSIEWYLALQADKSLLPIATSTCGDLYVISCGDADLGAIYVQTADSIDLVLVGRTYLEFLNALTSEPDFPDYGSVLLRSIMRDDIDTFRKIRLHEALPAQLDAGVTDLMVASFHAAISVATDIVHNQRQLNATDAKGRTALHWAIMGHSTSAATLLKENRININSVDNNGKTALHYAIEYENERLLALLLGFGADQSIADVNGITPQQAAQLTTNMRMRRLFSE